MTKNPLVLNLDTPSANENDSVTEEKKVLTVSKEQLQESIKETETDIPAGYIAIKLPSNGRIEGIPTVLHFRDYTGTDALDLNVIDDGERAKTLSNVLKRMCFEGFDISLLPIEDVLYIIYVLQFTFISSSLEKSIYLDETLPDGDDEGELDYEDNIETVTIPFNAIHVTYLGLDENDKNLGENVRFPITITDKNTDDKIRVKLASLKDTLVAENYCKNFYKDKFLEFGDVRKALSEIQGIKKKALREEKYSKYVFENEEKIEEYQSFLREYALTVAKFVQAMQVVAYNGKEITDIEEKWDLYNNSISSNMWKFYNSIVEKYHFGLNEIVEVFSEKLNKKVSRRVSFQLSDFLSLNREERNDRFSLSFD